MRDIPLSRLILDNDRMERHDPEGMLKTAREKADWVLAHHRPAPLERAVERELARIVDTADREIRGDR
jgi:trimethylamine:corrinoid methyltransferase-like protein